MVDPITVSAGIYSVLTTFGVSAGTAASVGLTLAPIVISTGASAIAYGASAALEAALGTPKSGGAIGSAGNRVTVRQPVPRQQLLYGSVFTAGAMFFIAKDPPYIVIGYLLGAGESEDVPEFYLNGTRAFLDGNGYATSTPFSDGTTNFVQMSVRLGTSAQTLDAIIAAHFPNVASTFRQRGHTTVVMSADYGADDDEHRELYGDAGQLQPIFRVKGRKVYDPRDGAQSVDDDSTWEWSETPSLCIADYLRHEYGGRLTSDQIDWDSVGQAATHDEQRVARKDGTTEKRYTLGGVVTLDAKPFDVIRSMLTANRGMLTCTNGKYGILSGVPQNPVRTIVESWLAGPIAIEMTRPRSELINKIRTEFVAPERDYQLVNGPLYEDATYQTADGQTNEATIRLTFTEGAPRAQRLAKAHLEQSRLGRILKATLNLQALELEAGDVVNVQFANASYADGTYRIDSIGWDPVTMTFPTEMSEYDAATVYAWDAATEEQDFDITEIDTST